MLHSHFRIRVPAPPPFARDFHHSGKGEQGRARIRKESKMGFIIHKRFDMVAAYEISAKYPTHARHPKIKLKRVAFKITNKIMNV